MVWVYDAYGRRKNKSSMSDKIVVQTKSGQAKENMEQTQQRKACGNEKSGTKQKQWQQAKKNEQL